MEHLSSERQTPKMFWKQGPFAIASIRMINKFFCDLLPKRWYPSPEIPSLAKQT